MNSKFRPYAWIGLIVSALALIFSLVYFYLIRKTDLYFQIGIGLVIIGFAIFALLDPQKLREFFTGKDFKYGSNMAIFCLAILGILVVLNFLANKYDPKWDLTEDKLNTMTDQSIEIVQSLPSKVEAIGFFTSNYSPDTAKTILENFKQKSNGKFTYRFIDPDNDPVTTKKYEITTDGSLVLLMDGRQQIIKVVSEDEVATALVKLSNPTTSTVYFLTGHGEHDPFATGDDAYSTAASLLEKKNYTIKPLNLLSNPKISEDADAIIIAGPKKPVSQSEVTLLAEFLKTGKSLIVMEDSPVTNDFGDSPDPLAEYLSQSWGISLGNSIVLDLSSNSLSQAYASLYGNHPIVNRLGGMVTIFPTARSVTPTDPAPAGITLTSLVSTSNNSWAETNIADLQNNKYQYDEGQDLQGPVSLAIAGMDSSTNGRVVVVGSSYFAVNSNFDAYGNGDFFVNSVDWATENEAQINLTPRETTTRVLVAPSIMSQGIIFLVSVVAFPLLIIVMGVTVWIQRRKRG
jgi:ABC-type uncharacterized transport system involved in gliding motility auxiliary subunit